MTDTASKTKPYTAHLEVDLTPTVDTDSFSFTREGVFRDGKATIPLPLTVVTALKSALQALWSEAAGYDYVATFALGGVFPLEYMVAMNEKSGGTGQMDKFHLFPGLGWEGMSFDPKERFIKWLDSLPENSRVLLFDTGHMGKAGGELRNLIKDHYQSDKFGKPKNSINVAIRVIAARPNSKEGAMTFSSENGNSANVDLKFLMVEDNPFEDAFNFIGFESLRTLVTIKSLRVLGGTIIDPGTHRNMIVGDVPSGFMKLFTSDLMLNLTSSFNNPATVPELMRQARLEPTDRSDD